MKPVRALPSHSTSAGARRRASLVAFMLSFAVLCSAPAAAEDTHRPNDPPINAAAADLPEWVRLMYSGPPNVLDVDAAYQAYYQTHPFEKNLYTQYYKRWRQWSRPFEQPDGSLRVPFHEERLAQQRRAREARGLDPTGLDIRERAARDGLEGRAGAGDWTFIGPDEVYNLKSEVGAGSQFPVAWHGNVYGVDIAPSNTNVLYCGTESGGLYKTTDKGLNWTMVNAGLVSGAIRGVRIHPTDPNTVYFNTSGNVYKSTDGGASWAITGNAAFQSTNIWVNDMAIHPVNPQVVFLATEQGFYRTTDGGVNWTQSMATRCWTVGLHPTNPDIVYTVDDVGNTSRFEKSTNMGASFVPKLTGWYAPAVDETIYGVRVTVTDDDPNRIYALIGADGANLNGYVGVFRSDDAGETWTHPHGVIGVPYNLATHPNLMAHNGTTGFYQGFYDFAIVADPLDADRIIVGGTSWWRSDDGASTYQALGGYVGSLPWSHPDMQYLRAIGGELWIATDGGLTYSTDFAATHEARNKGITGHEFWGFDSGWNEDILVGGRYHTGNAAYFETYPAGAFLRMGGGEAATGYVNYGESRATAFSDIGGRILPETFDGAHTSFSVGMWPTESYVSNESSEMVFDPRSWNIVYLGNGNGLWKSLDGGTTFTLLEAFGVSVHPIRDIEVARSDPRVIYLMQGKAGSTSAMWKTTDGGETWATLPNSPLNTTRRGHISVSAVDSQELWACNYWDVAGQRVWRTTDGGASWINWSTPTLDGFIIESMVHQYGTDGGVYLGTNLGNVFYRDNTLGDWISVSDGLPISTQALELKPFYKKGTLRNGTWNYGIWERDLYVPSSPVAQISVDRFTAYSSRDTLTFEDHSVLHETGATWNWAFPGGTPSSSTERRPRVTYAAPGTYDVSLSVSNIFGSDHQTLTDLITVTNEAAAQGVPGRSVQLDGAGDYVAALDGLDLDSDTVSMTAWIKRDGPQTHFAGILFCRGGTTTAGLSITSTHQLRYHWNDGGWWVVTGLTVPDGEWSHVGLVVHPDKVVVYLDGRSFVETVARGPEAFDTPLHIGSDPAGGRFFKGWIDEVCVYDRALSDDEIRASMHLTKKPAEDPSLRSYYQFNEVNGVVLDRAGVLHGNLAGDASRVTSTGPFGSGASAGVTVAGGGSADFGETGVRMDFPATGTYPNGDVWVTRLQGSPNLLPGPSTASSHYWVARSYGNTSFSALDALTFADLGVVDAAPGDYRLHRRGGGSDGGWPSALATATAASGANGGEIVFGAGGEVSSFGQFTIDRRLDPADVEDSSGFPRAFALGQSFPNPFRPAVAIKFQLPQAEHVEVDIFDQTGRHVVRLLSRTMPAGTHLVEWNAGDAPSGVYFYRLKAGAFTATNKMVRMR